ncbi:pyridoxamine 5'-phosphate oxidase [Mycolicibacterium litorale]|uniref:Pyridoxamine 5'-phosphate oxidase n=1 Tax=Mycolicibacterium litorale TaxID=758802 RepID=A0A6S6PC98_9MYCO|nr:pyridoxamine 5'-phosphate oxidase family protein [Mycolicibacterium litorale]BCI55247.1 pyridoxamine 5'-phosphate oxidase [Mycolicibacterium litorale]
MTHETPSEPVTALTEDESWALLSGMTLGRLALSVRGQPDIFPVNFVVQRRTILIRTAEGTKLAAAMTNGQVAFEVDEHNAEQAWSVVVKGRAKVLMYPEEIAEAERAQVLPWTAPVKRRFLRITPTSITGRRFRLGGEPVEAVDFG